MPDASAPLGPVLEALGPVVGAALRALVRSALAMVSLGVVCTAGSVWLAANGSVTRGAIAGVLCLVAAAFATGVVAVKNAILRGGLAAVEQLTLGARLVGVVFEQLGVGQETSQGAVGRLVERIPLGEAEQRLRGGVEGLLRARAAKSGARAWLARRLLGAVLERVERLTLARFRSEDAAHGGVDLRLVRDELGGAIDGLIARQLGGQATRLTALLAGAYAVVTVVIGLGVARLGV